MLLAPRNAVAVLSSYSRNDGIHEIRWALADGTKAQTLQYTPHEMRTDNMAAGPTLLQRTWDMLDTELDAILHSETVDREYHKVRAGAIAEVLAMFMPPHFTTRDQIAEEARRRYDARQTGDTEYETGGLGSRRYEPPAGTAHITPSRGASVAAKKAAPNPQPELQPQQVKFIQAALVDNTLTPEVLADMFKVSVETIKLCR